MKEINHLQPHQSAMKPHSRKLLQPTDGVLLRTSPPPTTTVTYSPDPLLQSRNASSSRRPFKPSSSFDSSMALTALVLLAALFFMGFFSIYVRRFADETSAEVSRRRRHRHHHDDGLPLSFTSSSLPPWWSNATTPKGVDPSTVRSLPLVSYRADAKHPIDCAICLSEFEEGETVKRIPYCRHVFHPECIDVWLSLHVSCPVCRSTQMSAVKEVRLGVVEAEGNHGVSEDQGRMAVARIEGRDERRTEVESAAMRTMRRVCSCSSLGDPVVLQRTLSF